MELAQGKVLRVDQAAALGVLDAVEGLVRTGPDKPWQALMPADVPTTTTGNAAGNEGTMAEGKHNVSLYRAMHHLNKGGLHRALGVPEGETIPPGKVDAAKHSTNEHVRHMANFASTMSGFHHSDPDHDGD